jgi:DNA-binding LacI/PurR family transcriptional regulator
MKKLDILNPEPLYLQLKRDLQREIAERRLLPGDKLWSEKELREKCGVSAITVRKALAELCKEGWIYKRQGMGSYVTERNQVRDLADQQLKNIAFIVCNKTSLDGFYSRVLHGAERAADERGCHLLYHSITMEEQTENFESKIRILSKANNTVGLIITGIMPPSVVTAAKKGPLSCVFVGDIAQKRVTARKVNIIAFDDYGAVFEGMSYLISLGHRRIGFLCGPLRCSWWIQMFQAYKDALTRAGIPWNRRLSVYCEMDTVEEGYRAINELFSRNNLPTAIMATNDMLAVGAMKGIKRKGLQIPQNISLIGIGDYEIGRYYEPPLTTMRCEVERLGERAVEILTGHNTPRTPTRELFPYQLVIRKSCQRVTDD